MVPAPVVTGLSPKEGPPGTKVTIRGEFLGTKPQDIVGLEICGIDCLLSAEWKSPNKIIARTGAAKGKGDIIVTTRLGGRGTSTVQFRAYHETIGPLKESAVWVEETSPTIAWGRRVLTPNTSDDPLGLSIEGDKKIPDDLREIFPDGTGDLTQENFNPAWFLLENHLNTSFEDLKAGLLHLKRKIDSQTQGKIYFLKENSGAVIDQLDTLMTLREKFQQDVKEVGLEQTKTLEQAIQNTISSSHTLFSDVLARREKADATRAALAALSRHKFLFCLPNSIERCVKSNDFDIICNDYARARNLFGKTDVPIFKQVLQEVDNRIVSVRKVLHEKIREMPQGVENQKKLVKALINLENQQKELPGMLEGYKVEDPAWDAIEARAKYLEKTFKETYEGYMARETPQNTSRSTNKETTPNRLLFCEEMNEIGTGQFPDLWRLGQAYFSGELRGMSEPKAKNFKTYILSTIELFCSYLKCALLPNAKNHDIPAWPSTASSNNLFAIWIPQCLRYVRVTYATLIRLDLPNEALDIVSKLINDLRLYSLSTIFKKTNEKVKKLVEREMWEIKVMEFPGATLLPSKLEELLNEALEEAQTVCLTPEMRETVLIEPQSDGQREIAKRVQDILNTFCGVVETLAMQRTDEESQAAPTVSQLIGFPSEMQAYESVTGMSDTNWADFLTWEQRLLCCLANCAYCNKEMFPKIDQTFAKYGLNHVKLAIESGRSNINQLFSSLLEIYVEHKSDPLVGTIEPSMYIGHFQWDQVEEIGKLSPYAHECCDNLVGVYSEIFSISPFLLRPVLEPIVQTVAEELARLMTCVQKFSEMGAMQAYVDIKVIQDALKVYSNSVAKTFFNEALEAIPTLSPTDRKASEVVIEDVKKKMRLQVICLSVVDY
ncbi:exocyst complex component 2 [Culicoides brevitarsis]|uniref:exocyst complex component 2 n=1 Tax=Culicoides brevitarsis TaxID=469753 RepID=UPI00307C7627